MSIEYPWPESPDHVERRVRGIVNSLVGLGELEDLRLEWVTPSERPAGFTPPSWVVLRVTVLAKDDEGFQLEFWGPDWPQPWEDALRQLASDLEDWVCETSFGWGQQRLATIPS